MTITRPEEISKFLDEVTSLKTLPLNLVHWQVEYKEKLGLSDNTPPNDNDTANLPLHPRTLRYEIDSYKDHINTIKASYMQMESQSRFLSKILQEPPIEFEEKDVQQITQASSALLQKFDTLLKELEKMKEDIGKLNAANEKSRQELMARIDEVTTIMDNIYEQERELTRLQTVNEQYAKTKTSEEARALLNQQSEELAEISRRIDAKRDNVGELEWRIDDNLQEIEVLESELPQLQAQAREAVEKSQQNDPHAEEKGLWYLQMTKLCNSMFGIDQATFDVDLIRVTFATGDTLSITLDALTECVTGVKLDNGNIYIEDLVDIGMGEPISEVGSTMVLETLARLKHI